MNSRQKREREQFGARDAGSRGWMFRLHIYVQRHMHALFASLGQLWRSPLSTLMTTLTIAVTLALPAGLFLILKTTDQLTASWQGEPQLSVFMTPGSSETAIKTLIVRLENHAGVDVQAQIPPEDGMLSFSKIMGMEGILDILDENPLPYVVVLSVDETHRSVDKLTSLVAELADLPGVDLVQFDLAWLEKLTAILGVVERGLGLVAVFLALAVLMTIGNTVRLSIQNRLEEIEVMKLVGAKDAFIRRPFLYGGLWLGLISGLFALVLLFISRLVLEEPMAQVLELYEGAFSLSVIIMVQVSFALVLGAALLGWLGAWIALARQLRRIEPK